MAVDIDFLPAEVNLRIMQGDDIALDFTIEDLNLQGGTGLAQMRAGESRDTTLLATFGVTLTNDGADTDVELTLAGTENTTVGNFYWDLQVTYGGLVRTYMAGTVEVFPDVSNT